MEKKKKKKKAKNDEIFVCAKNTAKICPQTRNFLYLSLSDIAELDFDDIYCSVSRPTESFEQQ